PPRPIAAQPTRSLLHPVRTRGSSRYPSTTGGGVRRAVATGGALRSAAGQSAIRTHGGGDRCAGHGQRRRRRYRLSDRDRARPLVAVSGISSGGFWAFPAPRRGPAPPPPPCRTGARVPGAPPLLPPPGGPHGVLLLAPAGP